MSERDWTIFLVGANAALAALVAILVLAWLVGRVARAIRYRGLARKLTPPERIWFHNDERGGPQIFLIDAQNGRTTGSLRMKPNLSDGPNP